MPRTLAQNAQYIAETIKPAIKSAIEAQGVTVPSTDSFLDYADRIGEIEGGGSGYQLKDLPTGSISTVTDAAELPLNALKVSVEAWQEGSGDPSPSNIRPIHGWSEANLWIQASVDPTANPTATADFNTTVYGARVNLLTGDGVIDRISHTINDFSAWNYQGVNNYKALYIKLSDLDLPPADISKVNLCAFDKSKQIANGYGQPYGTASLYAANNGTIYFWNNDDYYSGGNAMINGMNALGGVQIVYYLAEPIPFTFTPIPTTKMLQGTNNLYADCGEVIEGEYFSGSAKGYVDGIKYAGEGDGGIASYTNVKSADELLGATAITFEVYARIDSYVSKTSGAYARLMEFGNSQQTGRLGFIGLASDNDNNLCYWDDTADIASGIDTWTLGDTHLISVVKTIAGALKIYVDGVLKYTGSSTLSITTSIIDFVAQRGIYAQPTNIGRQLNGEVFAWRVYGKELSAANIAQNLTADRSLYAR